MKPTKLSVILVAASVVLFSWGITIAAPPIRAQHALGIQRVLVLTVSFPDVPTVPPLGAMKKRMLDGPVEYYATQSYGKTQIQGDVSRWYQLPRPLAEYKLAPVALEVDKNRVRRLVEDAFNAADKDVVFARYDHVIIVVGAQTGPGVGYGIFAYCASPGIMTTGGIRRGNARMETITTRSGQRFSGGIVVVAQNAHLGHVVHDLAHTLGGVVGGKRPIPDLYDIILESRTFPRSLEAFPKWTVFMGPWDLLSRHFVTFQLPPPGMSSFTRLRMGWIESDQVVEVGSDEGRAVALSPLADGKGTLAIKVPGRWGTHYLLENRQTGPGDPVLPVTGLLILQVDESREDGDGIVRVVNANPAVADFGAAAYGVKPGQTPSARLSGNTAVEVLWQRGADLTVMVTTASRASEMQTVATRIREMNRKLLELPESPAYAEARADLATAMNLLMQMKSADASARVDAIKLP